MTILANATRTNLQFQAHGRGGSDGGGEIVRSRLVKQRSVGNGRELNFKMVSFPTGLQIPSAGLGITQTIDGTYWMWRDNAYPLFRSTDCENWTGSSNSAFVGQNSYKTVASDTTGQYVIATTVFNGHVAYYYSSNYGNSFTASTNNLPATTTGWKVWWFDGKFTFTSAGLPICYIDTLNGTVNQVTNTNGNSWLKVVNGRMFLSYSNPGVSNVLYTKTTLAGSENWINSGGTATNTNDDILFDATHNIWIQIYGGWQYLYYVDAGFGYLGGFSGFPYHSGLGQDRLLIRNGELFLIPYVAFNSPIYRFGALQADKLPMLTFTQPWNNTNLDVYIIGNKLFVGTTDYSATGYLVHDFATSNDFEPSVVTE
jgi:hypothetical protein